MDDNENHNINIDKICRLCLQEKRCMVSIFVSQPGDTLPLDQRIMACATIQILEGDGLPSKICSKCISSVNSSYEFKTQVEDADKTLQEYIQFQAELKKQVKNGDWNVEIKEEKDPDEFYTESDMKYDSNQNEDDLPVHEFLETTMKSEKPKRKKRAYTKYLNRKKNSTLHPCETCGKILRAHKSLVRHCLVRHNKVLVKEKKNYQCLVCLEKFEKWSELSDHEKASKHHGKEKCKYCEKMLSRSYMTEHLRNHTGEKPYLCNLCGRSFAQVSAFYKHKKLCSNAEKKLKCSYCDKRFYERYTLMEHERIHTNEKPFVCETCGKAFRRKSKLDIHQLSHSNSKPHKCSVCERSFRQRVHLTEHFRIHSGVKPYRCDICGASFTQGHSLKSHKIKHV